MVNAGATGKKKKKKTKAELEAERIEKEALEAELAAEEERKREEDRKKAEAEAEQLRLELKEQRKEEVKVLSTEYEDEKALYDKKQYQIDRLNAKAKKEKEWQRHLACSTLPLIESPPEIHAYISEQYDALKEEDGSITTHLVWIAKTQHLSRALLAQEAEEYSTQNADLVSALYDANCAQIDKISSHVLQHADDGGEAKFEVVFQARDIDAFNAAKKIDIVSTKEDSRDISMTHPSSTSSMAHIKAKQTESRTGTNQSDTEGLTPSNTPGKVSAKARTPTKFFSAHKFPSSMNPTSAENVHAVDTLSLVRVDTDVLPEGAPINEIEAVLRGEIKIGVWANLVARPVRGPFKQISFADIELGVDLPKSLGTQRIAVRIIYFPYEHIPKTYRSLSPLADARITPIEEDDDCDPALLPSERMLILATLQLELLELPRKPVEVRPKLIIRQLTCAEQQGTVKPIHFPPGAEIGKDRVPLVAAAPSLNQFLRAKLKPPKQLLIPKDIGVAWFDARRGRWIDGTASKIEHNAAKREIGFNLTRSGILALVQCRTTDFPYTDWSLRVAILPNSILEDSGPTPTCVFTLVTPRLRLQVQVLGQSVQLIAPTDVPELEHLLEEPLTPKALLNALRSAGIHLRPVDADAHSLHLVPKKAALETKLSKDIAELASSFDFTPISQEEQNSPYRYALSVTETTAFMHTSATFLDDEYEPAFDSFCALVQTDQESLTYKHDDEASALPADFCKCGLVVGATTISVPKEADSNDIVDRPSFNDSLLGGAQSHASLCRALAPVSSNEAMQRLRQSSVLFERSVAELLLLTRPFSFCAPASAS